MHLSTEKNKEELGESLKPKMHTEKMTVFFKKMTAFYSKDDRLLKKDGGPLKNVQFYWQRYTFHRKEKTF